MTVWVDPGRKSGQPCIFGHRITVVAVAEMVWHDGVDAATDTWDLTRRDVLGACWYQARYTTRKWKTRWKAWADQNHGLMWKNEYAAVADPPSGVRRRDC